ncbi:MAG TPA: hypothetical protein VMU66_08435 [Gaiellales bacterium]|nr:hypothetical protein [Gaiellales bacterium]
MDDLDLLETLARAAAGMASPSADQQTIDGILSGLPDRAALPCRLWSAGGGLHVAWMQPPSRAQEAFVDALSSCLTLAVAALAAGADDLLSAAAFGSAVERAVAAAHWRGDTAAVAVFEVAGMILSPGYDGGPAVADVGAIARATVRQDDSVGHLGGGRFALLLPRAGSFEARSAYRRVREAIAAHQEVGGDLWCGPAGFAELTEDETPEELLATALERLAAARLRRAYTAPTDPGHPLAG